MESAQTGRFLPLDLYKPRDLEAVWKIPQDRLFKGYTIYFTPTLKTHYGKAFGDMEKLCKAVGARRVVSKKPGGKEDADTIYLAEAEGDPHVAALRDLGHTCYTKDFLTHSILAGSADLSNKEHVLPVAEEEPEEPVEELEKPEKPAKKPAQPVKRKGRTRKG